MKKGFDSSRYLSLQKREILKRRSKFDRLYIEFGGHLCYDGHASRVLPGYDPKSKIRLLRSLGKIEIIYCVSARDIDSNKRLGDFGLNYIDQTLKDLTTLKKELGVKINVAITFYSNQKKAKFFGNSLIKKGYSVFYLPVIRNYLKGAKYAVEGYDKYEHIPISNKLVVVTGAAGGSGKMATAMSQVYHDLQNEIDSGYAKFETFPIWNLTLEHPINIAYEAATADLGDKIMIDKYHLKKYGKKAVNYNRDIENFSILMKIAKITTGEEHPFGYYSPTDMGINMAKFGIVNDSICKEAAINEINRRYLLYLKEYEKGRVSANTLKRIKEVMKKVNL